MEINLETTRDIIAIIVAVFVFYKFSIDNYRGLSQSNLKELLGLYENIKTNHGLLKCYGIEPDNLKSTGLSVEQFVHLVQNFTAGEMFFDTIFEFNRKPTFEKDSYRYYLCSLETTKNAWKYLKIFFPPSQSYGGCIEKTIYYLHNEK
jgi:hypothetical protein